MCSKQSLLSTDLKTQGLNSLMVCIFPKLDPKETSWRKQLVDGSAAAGFSWARLEGRSLFRWPWLRVPAISYAQTGNCNPGLLWCACAVSMGTHSRFPPGVPKLFFFSAAGTGQQAADPTLWLMFISHMLYITPFPWQIHSIPDWFPRRPTLKTRNKLCGDRMLQKFRLTMFNNEWIQLSEPLVSFCN